VRNIKTPVKTVAKGWIKALSSIIQPVLLIGARM
jgi:hypothetical protein